MRGTFLLSHVPRGKVNDWSQLQNLQVLQFDEVAKLHPSVTKSSATTLYFSIYDSQAGFGETEGAAVMMSFAINSLASCKTLEAIGSFACLPEAL
jgi:hypothetical protein